MKKFLLIISILTAWICLNAQNTMAGLSLSVEVSPLGVEQSTTGKVDLPLIGSELKISIGSLVGSIAGYYGTNRDLGSNDRYIGLGTLGFRLTESEQLTFDLVGGYYADYYETPTEYTFYSGFGMGGDLTINPSHSNATVTFSLFTCFMPNSDINGVTGEVKEITMGKIRIDYYYTSLTSLYVGYNVQEKVFDTEKVRTLGLVMGIGFKL